MRIVIFGSTGNTGKIVTDHFLSKKHSVIGISRKKFLHKSKYYTHLRADITDKKIFRKLPKNVDLVINLAGVQPSIHNFSESKCIEKAFSSYVYNNIIGTFNILEFIRKNKIKNYVYITTHREFENYWSKVKKIKNNLPASINYSGDHSMYAITKTSAKMIGDYYSTIFKFRHFNLRLPMIFLVPKKPYYLVDGKPKLMPFLKIIKDAIQGKTLEVWGNPLMKRDYVYVDNLLNLIDKCLSSKLQKGTFNVGTGEGVTTENFVKKIAKYFHPLSSKAKIVYKRNNKTYKSAVYDISEQKTKLNYKPIYLDDMLKKIKNVIYSKNLIRIWKW